MHTPPLRINKVLTKLKGACVFSWLDLQDSYYPLPIFPANHHKTTFTCCYSTFQFIFINFFFCSALNTFKQVMNIVFLDMLDKVFNVYLDNMLIYSMDT